jgi:hypothetical protein
MGKVGISPSRRRGPGRSQRWWRETRGGGTGRRRGVEQEPWRGERDGAGARFAMVRDLAHLMREARCGNGRWLLGVGDSRRRRRRRCGGGIEDEALSFFLILGGKEIIYIFSKKEKELIRVMVVFVAEMSRITGDRRRDRRLSADAFIAVGTRAVSGILAVEFPSCWGWFLWVLILSACAILIVSVCHSSALFGSATGFARAHRTCRFYTIMNNDG